MAVTRTRTRPAGSPSGAPVLTVSAGFLEGATYPDGTPVPLVALANEFGSHKTAARPFFRNTVASQSAVWSDSFRKLLVAGRSPRQALETIGQVMQEDIQTAITQWPADNSPKTVARKGFNHGLIDTAHMLRSVSWEVKEGEN